MNKKTIKTLSRGSSSSSLWLCIALLALCGCSAVENETTEQGKSMPIGVQAAVAGSKEQLDTRAVIPGLITTEGAKMGVFLISQSQNGYEPVYDKKYIYQGTGLWTTTEPIYVDKRPAKLVAYYDPNNMQPFPNSPTTTVSKPDALTAQKFDAGKIWYYDSTQPDLTSASPNVTFQFKPAYARLKVSVLRAASYTTTLGLCAINGVGLATNGIQAYTTQSLDLSTGLPTGGIPTETPRIDPDIDGIDIGITNTDRCDFLLPPQDITEPGATLYIKVDGVERSVLIPASYFPGSKLMAGNLYTISVQIVGVATLELQGSVRMNDDDWGTPPGESNGGVDEMPV